MPRPRGQKHLPRPAGEGAPAPSPAGPLWLVRLQGARVRLGGALVLDDLHWSLERGTHWAVLGRNGSGKSTFLRLVRGDIWPQPGQGSRLYAGPQGPRQSPLGFRRRSALVQPELWEEYRRRGWNLSGLEVVCTGFWDTPLLYRRPSPEHWRRCRELMEYLGIAHLAGRPLLAMSRGQAQMVLLARALVGRPRVLLLDECTTGLDQEHRRLVLEAMQAAARQGTQLLVATHHPREVPPAVDRALVLEGGRMVGQGPLEQMAPAPPAQAPVPCPAAPCPQTGAPVPGPLFQLEQVSVVRGGRRVLEGLNWTVQPGQHWAVLGRNGSGKTTLLGLLLGDFHPVAGGRIRRFGDDNPQSIWEIRRRVGYLSAEFQADQQAGQTVWQTVLSGFAGSLGLQHRPSAQQESAARRWLEFWGLADLARRRVESLSPGQLRKVLLARALVHDPPVLLLDEPLGVLDAPSRREVRELLDRLARGGTCLIYVTHRPRDLVPAITHLARLEGGHLVQAGPRPAQPPRASSW